MKPCFWIVIAALVVFSAGCINESQEMSAESIRDKTLGSIASVDSYDFDTNIDIVMSSGYTNMSMLMLSSGGVDVKNRRMLMNNTIEIAGVTLDTITYVMNDTVYTEVDDRWSRETLGGEEFWGEENDVQKQSKLLKTAAVKKLPDTEMNGKECYVIEISPNKDAVVDYLLKQVGTKNPEIDEAELKKIAESIQRMSMKEWVIKDTYLPTRIAMEIDTNANNITTTMRMVFNFYDYNKAQEIELPADALK